MKLLKQFHNDDRGQDLLEYSLIAVIIALGCLAGMSVLAGSINKVFTKVAGQLT